MSENNKEQAVVAESKLEVKDEFTKRPDIINYDIEFEKGQYWVREDQAIAFILESNQYAVIIQYKIKNGNDDLPVFDYEAGQELMSVNHFRKFLKEREAFIVVPDKKMVETTLAMYSLMLENSALPKRLFLPITEAEANELIAYENYFIKKKIIPPPITTRGKKAFHWLIVGKSGLNQTCKLWDPNVDNWVLPTGVIDVTAKIGFVTEYGSLGAIVNSDDGFESFNNLIDRIIMLLQKKNFLFIESDLRNKLSEYASDDQEVNQKSVDGKNLFIKRSNFLNIKEDPDYFSPNLYPLYELNLDCSNNILNIFFSYNQKMVSTLSFTELQNNEYIPKSCKLNLSHF